MKFKLEVLQSISNKDRWAVIHRASCSASAVSGQTYPIGEFSTYESALLKAKLLGYTNLNGCYWCCFWNHVSSAHTENSQ